MLSLILYGRNDSHGYNLHKRAAISLNAMAEVLTDPDDEIIFVDYNTPDDLPTFTEAIQDTLTANAKRRMRVLRVRPRDHQRFVGRTHLVALEPIARNIALRRSNPANRWILSTNTDMVFVPGRKSATLTEIVGGLSDGFYHLPRFEIPECLWETFDRRDGKGIIARVRDWSKRFHLNEIVYGHPHNLYDAPGDFQLALRDDLFAIDAFHEEMILGWHVDSNLAKRMLLHKGEVRSALDHLTGYHCDHTRQATLMHRRDRVMNDQARFIENVVAAEVPEQRDSWGMPEADIEEISLERSVNARYIEALETALPAGNGGMMEAWYTTEAYNDLRYDSEHVIPYLVDLLSCAPIGSRIAYVGSREDTFGYLAAAVATLDPRAAVLTPASFAWLKDKAATAIPPEAWLTDADIYVFEIGERPAVPAGPAYPARNAAVMALFEKFVEVEEEEQIRCGRAPRRVIAVNAIHNAFDQLVSASISHTTTPFSSRTRHGYVTPERLKPASAHHGLDLKAAGELLSARMGRSFPAPADEVRRLLELVSALSFDEGADEAAWDRAAAFAEPLLVLLGDHRLVALTGRREAEVQPIVERLQRLRPSAALGARRRAPVLRRGRAEAASRLANLEDWEDPAWFRWVRRMFGGANQYDLFLRRPWVWERASILTELDREFRFPTRPVGERPRILVVAQTSEYLAACLIAAGASVDFAHADELLGGPEGADWRGELHWIPMALSEPIGRLAGQAPGARYDAVVFAQNAAMELGRGRFADLVAAADRLLRPEGVLAVAGYASLVGQVDDFALPAAAVAGGRLSGALSEAGAYEPLRGFDDHLSPATADRGQLPGAGDPEPFIVDRGGPATTGLWLWRKLADQDLDLALLQAVVQTESEPEELVPPAAPVEPALPDPVEPVPASDSPAPAAPIAAPAAPRPAAPKAAGWAGLLPLRGPKSALSRAAAAERRAGELAAQLAETRAELRALSLSVKALAAAAAGPGEAAMASGHVLAADAPLASHPCRQADLESRWAGQWRSELDEAPRYHRALWESLIVMRALHEHGSLRPGARFLGLSPRRRFADYLVLQGFTVDEAALADAAQAASGAYDACWSCSSPGHLGSIEAGSEAVLQALRALRPGGLGVFTLDFNFADDDDTVETGGAVLFRRRDLEALARNLEMRGHEVAPLDFDLGDGAYDRFLDVPPFTVEGAEAYRAQWRDYVQRPHLKALISGRPTTSFALVVRRRE